MMQTGQDPALPGDIFALGYAEHLLVWTLRRLLTGEGAGPTLIREFTDVCDGDAGAVLASFGVFIAMLGHAARRPLGIGRSGWLGLTGDERQVLELIAAAQDDDRARLDAHLRWMAGAQGRRQLGAAARALGAAFARHDLYLVVATALSPTACPPADGVHLRLVS